MRDEFDRMMERFLLPISELAGPVNDCTYLLHNDGSLVFAQGYYHPPGMISGKVIYYPKKGGWVDIFGREYECIHKTYKNGMMYSYTNPRQIERYYEVFPEGRGKLEVAPLVKNNLLFPRSDFTGFFDPANSLKRSMELHPKIDKGVRAASELLEVPLNKMGLTGSLAYGRLEEHDDDTDMIFYGKVGENQSIMRNLFKLNREDKKRHVYEFGKYWPLRVRHGGILVCPFFIYSDRKEIPLIDCGIRSIKKGVKTSGRITDIRHSIYMPLVLPLENALVGGEGLENFILILADSYVRGEFAAGERIEATGELVEIEKGNEKYLALIVANNWEIKPERNPRPPC